MKKNFYKYAMIEAIIFLKLFSYALNTEFKKNSNSTGIENNNFKKSNKKALSLLIVKTIASCLSIILLYIILNHIIKRICDKKEIYKYLNSILEKNGFISDECFIYIAMNLKIEYFFQFIETQLMNTCKFKNRLLYTKYDTGCSICLGEFKPSTKVIITSCRHIFHYKCMKKFLNLIEREMNKKKEDDENFANFSNHFKCPNCKINMLQKTIKTKEKENNEKNIIPEIKVINIKNLNKLNNDTTNRSTLRMKDTKSSELSLSSSNSSVNLNDKNLKKSRVYPRKRKLFRKKINRKKNLNNNFIKNEINNNTNEKKDNIKDYNNNNNNILPQETKNENHIK